MPTHHPDPSPHQFRRGVWLQAAGTSRKADGEGVARAAGLPLPACIFLTRGRLHLRNEHGSWRVGRDGLIWLLPERAHRYQAEGGSDECWFICDGPVLRALVSERVQPDAPVIRRCSLAVRQAIGRAWQALEDGHPRANELACLAIEEILAHQSLPQTRHTEDADELVDAALELIAAAGGQVHPQALATQLGVPDSTLRRRFRAARGESLSAGCTRERLRRARRLLADTELPIAAVAEACGYADPFFFARQFRKHLASSPSAWRRSCRLGRVGPAPQGSEP